MTKRWGALPLEPEPIPPGDGWRSMPGQPRACSGCGERVKLTKEAISFKTSLPPQTWHCRCLNEQKGKP
jgi:hypothetical protein